jgi:hypothetical protein
MTPKKDPRAEEAAEKYVKRVWKDGRRKADKLPNYSREDFLEGVSWKEANPTPHKQSVEMRFADIANGRDTPTPQATDAKMPPRDGFGSTAYGGKDFPKLFVRRDIEFHTKEIQAKTVPDEEFCVEYLPQHDAVAVAKRIESAVSQERARTLRAVEALWNEWYEDRGVFGSCLGEMVHNANAKAPVEPAKAAGSPNGAGEK